MSRRSAKGLTAYTPQDSFEAAALQACFSISAADNTRKAYWADVRRWVAFCRAYDVDPWQATDTAVAAWVESMRKDGTASKTRARRVCGLCSVYDRIRRKERDKPHGKAIVNPFSVENGPKRERAVAKNPTPIASPGAIVKLLETCTDAEGIRDEAIIRILWATGARRASVTGMTHERITAERDAYVAQLIGKGQKEIRVLIRGRAAAALKRWLSELEAAGMTTGGIWRSRVGAVLAERDVWSMLRRRAQLAGVKEKITPHTFRVSFLTFNPAGLEAKQDAAGHADPATTRLYDRNWRGREAFEAMPEPEDLS